MSLPRVETPDGESISMVWMQPNASDVAPPLPLLVAVPDELHLSPPPVLTPDAGAIDAVRARAESAAQPREHEVV
jgi:hypothetical protein